MHNFENDIINSLKVLHQGGVILYPTDTIWGLGCDATNTAAVKKIFQLKKRKEKKSMIILVSHEDEISQYVVKPSIKIIDFLSVQQKPTTAIFEKAINLPEELISKDGSIAIRIVEDHFCKNLIEQLNKPLVSTSANISGSGSPKNFSEIDSRIKNGADYIVQHRQDEKIMFTASAIIRLNAINEIEKIR